MKGIKLWSSFVNQLIFLMISYLRKTAVSKAVTFVRPFATFKDKEAAEEKSFFNREDGKNYFFQFPNFIFLFDLICL
jgi:hypothetical protein